MVQASATDVQALRGVLAQGGLHAALQFLNDRTPHRFTGVYRFDGEMLRNVALYDRWAPDQKTGNDAPMVETFCAIVGRDDSELQVSDGRSDPRFPWMRGNPVVSYCGVPVPDAQGRAIGSLCHFDVQPCQAKMTELPLLRAAAVLFADLVRAP